jgi:hyperosmotically inducible protein
VREHDYYHLASQHPGNDKPCLYSAINHDNSGEELYMLRLKLIRLMILLMMVAVCVTGTKAIAQAASPQRGQEGIIREIRHELVTLPYYDVFDWLEGEVRTDGTVVLRGQVVRPTTKSEAESRVKDIEGVERVVNEIEVLPVSPNDDRLRRTLYRTLFSSNSPLFRYAHRAVPPIHIIVKNGRVTLKGIVATTLERQTAYIKARSVSGVFDVKNELSVEGKE